jgi:hypothetical protein
MRLAVRIATRRADRIKRLDDASASAVTEDGVLHIASASHMRQ